MTRLRTRAVIVLLVLMMGGLVLIGLIASPVAVFFPAPLPTLSPQGHHIAINANQQRSRPVQALYHVEALAARVGWTPDLHRQAGDLWVRLGDDDRALFHWEQAAAHQDDLLLLRAIADIYLVRGDWAPATDTLERILTQQPDNAWANYHLGMIRAPFTPTAAEAHLRQAALDPLYNEPARAVRVAIIESQQQTDEETRLPMLIGLAMIDHELWRYAELALDHANDVSLSTVGEPLPEALAYMSLAQDRQGKDGGAAIIAAVQLAPNDAQIRYLLALHYRYAENYPASRDAMIQAVWLSPENPALYAELGTAYRLLGEFEQAERWLQTAVEYSGNAPEYQRLLALFYAEEAFNLGSDGLLALDDMLNTYPDDPDLLAGMGWALFTLGEQAQGRAQVEQALAIDPDNPRATFYKAQMLLILEEDQELARQLLEQVAASDSSFAEDARRVLETMS